MRKLLFIASIIFAFVSLSVIPTDASTIIPTKIGYKHLTKEAKKQATCLSENIYFEAGHESDEGKLAVAMVTLNRVASPNFPDTICEVVHQKINGTCQFSWLCDQSFLVRRSSAVKTQLYYDIREIAIFAMMNYETIDDMTKGAMYYHANYVHPPWKLNVTARIGNHIFYKRTKDLKWKKEYRV